MLSDGFSVEGGKQKHQRMMPMCLVLATAQMGVPLTETVKTKEW